jgi:hypothetical protein
MPECGGFGVQVVLEESSLSPVTLSSTVYSLSYSLLKHLTKFLFSLIFIHVKKLSAVLSKTSSYSYLSQNQTHNLCIPIQSLQCLLISQMIIVSHDFSFFSFHISSYYQQPEILSSVTSPLLS